MNQRLIFNLEKEINGNIYRLCIPLGVQWNEALEVIKQFAETAVELARQAEEKAKDQQTEKIESEEAIQEVS